MVLSYKAQEILTKHQERVWKVFTTDFFATLSWDHHLLQWTVNTWQFRNGGYA